LPAEGGETTQGGSSQDAPRPPPSVEPQPADAAQPPAHIEDMLAALRREQRQPELRPNAVLAKVAQEHAQRVCERGVIAHELEPGANPERRLLAAGIKARRVGETVARSTSAETAFSAFEHSPSHRLTLLERGFTDVGVGQGTDSEQRHCVVVLLAEWPRFVGR
jgi:uncharacterized protein YkwD